MSPPFPIRRNRGGLDTANLFQYDISGQSSQDVADTLRLLIWVSGAIPDLERLKRRVISYSPAILYYKNPMRFTIDWEESEPRKFGGTAMPVGTCWNTTFRHFNVATSFPIPPRPVGFVGLEAPLGLVSDLAQIEYMLPYLDTFVLKGERTALIPLDYNTDDSKKVTEIQWHLVESSNGQLLSMDTDDGYEPSNLGCLGPDDYNRILKSENIRHFVGLYQEASLHFGTAESSSRGIDSVVIGRDGVTSPSGRSAGWQRTFSISSSISLPAFGSIGVSTSFKPVRRNTRALNVDRSLESWVRLACKNITLLYDVRTKTAWLVPEICAIFHLMKAWIIYLEPPANPLLMFPTSSEIHLDLAGEQQHCVNFTRQLSEEHRKILEEFFKAFRMLKEDIIFRSKGPRLRFANFCGQSGRLTGVDFQQLASLPEIVTPLNVKINDRTGGPWIEMLEANWNKAVSCIKRGTDSWKATRLKVVSLLCHDLRGSPPIQPMPNKLRCRNWDPIPNGCDYMVTTVQCLQHLTNNYPGDRGKISPSHWWTEGNTRPFDFQPCQLGGRWCNRLQLMLSEEPSDKQRARADEFVREESERALCAIVFGSRMPTDTSSERCRLISCLRE
ncbi:hypothetical protein F5883DRAFT_113211 [Diaporthe sp. PMI_573]|nr:hypothetical protein F5883DRAFT_113211 [Diaporthaceae sp. PMI_573]